MRLTRLFTQEEIELFNKNSDDRIFELGDYCSKSEETHNSEVYNKLGPLEDIEDIWCVDLLKVCQAIEHGFYAIQYGWPKNQTKEIMFLELKQVDIKRYDGKLAFVLYLATQRLSYTDFLVYLFEDYGKTWALTKEELL